MEGDGALWDAGDGFADGGVFPRSGEEPAAGSVGGVEMLMCQQLFFNPSMPKPDGGESSKVTRLEVLNHVTRYSHSGSNTEGGPVIVAPVANSFCHISI